MIQKKVCVLGDFAVGKTSLVTRFVKSLFSDKYLTTVGVKIEKKSLQVGTEMVALLLWDLHGEDQFQRVRTSYLRGAAGYFLVVDCTRPATLDTAFVLHQRARETIGEVPFVVLLNKADLSQEWEAGEKDIRALIDDKVPVIWTSAKTGDGVEKAFHTIAAEILEA